MLKDKINGTLKIGGRTMLFILITSIKHILLVLNLINRLIKK